jgi:hypothetical protein
MYPQACQCEQERYAKDIECCGKVKRETVKDDIPYVVCPYSVLVTVKTQEKQFGYDKDYHSHTIDFSKI